MRNKDIKPRGLSFVPLLVFLALYIGSGLLFTSQGEEGAFGIFPRHVALFIGIALALIMYPKLRFGDKVDVFASSAGDSSVMMIVIIYLLAGGFQGAASAMGGVESIVNLGLTYIPSRMLLPGIFIMTAFIATSIGTSMGTIAAMGPIAVSIAEAAGMNMAATCAAVIGAAYFGDNLSIISDTTISATQGVGAEMKDKFRMNFFIALPAAIVAVIIYGLIGTTGTTETGQYSLIKIVPYILVLITALMGLDVIAVLMLGILSTGIIGLLGGSVTLIEWVQGIGDGMSGMMSISIVAILISGLIGLIRYYGGVDWLIDKITSRISTRRGAEYGISFLSGLLSIALVNNTIAIIISAPIAKEIGAGFNIAPRRLASLLDIFACAFLAMAPHDGGMLIMTGLTGVSPVEVLKYSYYLFFLILFALATIKFGLLRTIEEREN